MIQKEEQPAISPELVAESEAAVAFAMSGERDPEAMPRAAERMDRMWEETFDKYGLLEIGVPVIRDLRGGLPK
jgi:hypothetical protein